MPLSWLPLGQVRASASSRREALESSRLEELASPEGAITYVAGGKQTKGALPVKTRLFDSAVYSSRGRGYARYNEDAAVLFADEHGQLFAAVFDQAGGLGGVVRGAASQLAAEQTFHAFRQLAIEGVTEDDTSARHLIGALLRAHDGLVARSEGEVTTAVTAVLREGRAIVVNSGDSAALHYDRGGRPKAITQMHEHVAPIAQGCLTHAVGLIPEGAAPDAYRWSLDPGDWLILCTDGLLDAGLSADEMGEVLAKAESAEDAVNRLTTRVLRLMTIMRAKPDNLTMIALRSL